MICFDDQDDEQKFVVFRTTLLTPVIKHENLSRLSVDINIDKEKQI